MNRPLALLLSLLCAAAHGTTLREALASPEFVSMLRGDGRGELTVTITNRSAAEALIEIPAGFVASATSGARLAAIRGIKLEVPTGKTAEVSVPAVPLSLRNPAKAEPYTATADQEKALRPLLDYSEKNNDLPRPTAQLTALLLLNNVTFATWRDFLGHEPAPAEIATAIDALAIARQLQPDRTFALAQDAELRLLALRQPLARAKAMQLFGMAAPEGVPVPDVNQLLHTRPGDNCPICRMRAQMDRAGNGL